MNEKLTAYALNELLPDEREQLEAQMKNDPALRKQADEVRAFCELLGREASTGGDDALMPAQRAKLMQEFQRGAKVIRPLWRRPAFLGGLGLAAAAGIAVMLSMQQVKETSSPMPVPRAEPSVAVRVTSASKAEQSAGQLAKEMKKDSVRVLADHDAAAPPKSAAEKTMADKAKKLDAKVVDGLVAMGTSSAPSWPVTFGGGNLIPSVMPPLTSAASQTQLGITDYGRLGFRDVSAAFAFDVNLSGISAAPSSFALNKLRRSSGTLGSSTVTPSAAPSDFGLQATSPSSLPGIGNGPSASKDASTLEFRTLGRANEGLIAPGGPVEMSKSGTAALAITGGTLSTSALTVNSSATGTATRDTLSVLSAPKEAPVQALAMNGEKVANPVGGAAMPAAPVSFDSAADSAAIAGGRGGSVTASGTVTPIPSQATVGSGASGTLSAGTFSLGNGVVPQPMTVTKQKSEHLLDDGTATSLYYFEQAGRGDSEAESLARRGFPTHGTAGFYKLTRERGKATYRPIIENPFNFVAQQPLSTFSLDVDTASYANVRRFLNSAQRPPPDAVRLEELVNYFPYHYDAPAADKPLAVQVAIADSPWQPLHRIARIAVKARDVKGERSAANFVFLIDVSGSMQPQERLPLIKQSLRLLVNQLRVDDRVAIVTYAGESGVALESTLGSQKEKIVSAIEKLNAGGSTNGASGIKMAYEQAAVNFDKNKINRVILCTDGDFNVGTSSVQELEKLIAEKAKSGVFLTALGVGTDNLHDHTMQALADRGNGNYHYLDSIAEARKVLVEQMTGTLVTVAKDVKVQIEFNPAQVAAYRLIGYEKRLLAKEDFNNDKKDAGEIGAGHTVTVLYEIVPASLKYPDGKPVVDDLKYAPKLAENAPLPELKPDAPATPAAAPAPAAKSKAQAPSNECMTVKVRYKEPGEDKSKLFEVVATDSHQKLSESDKEFQFAVSVAGFGMLLRGSPNVGELTWENVRKLALSGKGPDEQGWRGEFIQLIEKARGLCEAQK